MTMIDIGIVAIVGLSCIMGVLRGLIREALSLCVWIFGGFFAAAFDERAAPWFTGVIDSPQLRLVAGFALVFVAGVFLGGIVTNMVSKLTSALGLGSIDSALGMLFGLLRGVLIITVVIVLTIRLDVFRTWYADSLLVPYFLGFAEYLAALVGLDPALVYPRANTTPI